MAPDLSLTRGQYVAVRYHTRPGRAGSLREIVARGYVVSVDETGILITRRPTVKPTSQAGTSYRWDQLDSVTIESED